MMIPIALSLLCSLNLAQEPQESEAAGKQVGALRAAASEISEQITQLRGKAFQGEVQVQVSGRAAFLRYARERMESLHGPLRMGLDQQVAHLAGLIPWDMDLEKVTLGVLEEQVGGFYDPKTDTFYIMEGFSPDFARLVMAHELTHALDDQYHDLDGTDSKLRANSDAILAHHAVAEGSAQVVTTRWLQANLARLDQSVLLEQQAAQKTDALQAAPPFIWKPLLGLYSQGQAFLERGLDSKPGQAQLAGLEAAFLKLPRSTEQILHPSKYWDEEQWDEPVQIDIGAGSLAEGWELALEDTFGEMMLALLCEPLGQRTGMSASPLALAQLRFSNASAAGWGGDCFVLLRKAGAQVLFLVTAWDSPKDADEFLAAMKLIEVELRERAGGKAFDRGYLTQRVDDKRVDWMAWRGIDAATAKEIVRTLEVRL